MVDLDSNTPTRTPEDKQLTHFFTKGEDIEININNDEINGAWYSATILKAPSKVRKNMRIQYKNLIGDDGFSPLVEHVEPFCVRPLPPREEFNPCVFEERDVVDAWNRDGWWTGTIMNVLEGSRYRVIFDNPPDIIDFDGSDLRVHFDWVSGKWVRPGKKTVMPSYISWNPMEVNPDKDKIVDFVGTPAPIIIESTNVIETSAKTPLSMTPRRAGDKRGRGTHEAGDQTSAKRASLQSKMRTERNQQQVEGSSGRRGRGRGRKSVARISKFSETGMDDHVAGNITNGSTKKEKVENNLDLPSSRKVKSPVSQDACDRGTVEAPKSPSLQENGVNMPMALVPKNVPDADDDQPLSTWIGGLLSSKPANNTTTEQNKDDEIKSTPADAEKTPDVFDGNSLPFKKMSPFWQTIESMEVFQITPQKPHFGPLVEYKEDYREGTAIGMMVSFSNMLEKISAFGFDDDRRAFENTLDSLRYFEKHGFEVSIACARVTELLRIKDGQAGQVRESENTEKQIKECSDEIKLLDDIVVGIEKQMKQLAEDLGAFKSKRVSMELNLHSLQDHAASVRDRMKEAREAFEKVVSSPWKG